MTQMAVAQNRLVISGFASVGFPAAFYTSRAASVSWPLSAVFLEKTPDVVAVVTPDHSTALPLSRGEQFSGLWGNALRARRRIGVHMGCAPQPTTRPVTVVRSAPALETFLCRRILICAGAIYGAQAA